MADRTPCVWLAQQTLRWQAAEQRAACERGRVAVLELADRRARNDANIRATRQALSELEAQIALAPTPLERAKLNANAAALRATAARQELENLEGAERAARHDESLRAAAESLARYEAQLADLEAAHGRLTEERYRQLRSSIDAA